MRLSEIRPRAGVGARAVLAGALAALGTAVLPVPAAAAVTSATAQVVPVDRTAGIDRAGHTVTTHNGRVIRGVTFVDDRRASLAGRSAATAPGTATAANSDLACLPDWHFITGGGTNTYWKTNRTTKFVYGNGNRSADYWYQEYLPCWESTWELNAWALLSNSTGEFLDWLGPLTAPLQVSADIPGDYFNFASYTMFHLCDYDGNWKYLTYTTYVDGTPSTTVPYRDPGNASIRLVDPPLNGNTLFKVDPPILNYACTIP